MQCAFIDALVLPVFKLLAELLPLIDDNCIRILQSNRAFWNSMQNLDIITTSKITAYLEGVRDPISEQANQEEGKNHIENDKLEEPIPGIPANAPKAHTHHITRKLSMISMKDTLVKNVDDPEMGDMTKASNHIEAVESFNEKRTKFYANFELTLRGILEHHVSQGLLLVATIYALFANDVNIAVGSKYADGIVDTCTLAVLIMFVVEMIVSIICVPKYLQFFLWLDLAASVSLLFEIDLLFGYGDSPGDLSLAKASRAAKAGARAGR